MTVSDPTGKPPILTVAGERPAAPSPRPAIVAGVLGALDAAFLLCRAPRPPVPFATNRELLLRASAYVLAAALAGALCSSFFWKRFAAAFRRSLPVVALSSAAASVWFCPAVLLFRQDSLWMVPVTAVAAATLAASWRAIVPLNPTAGTLETDRTELFAQTLQPLPRSPWSFGLALCIYGACFELHDRDIVTASAMFGLCGFVFAWQLTLAGNDSTPDRVLRNRASLRLLRAALPAILVAFLALLAWNPRHNQPIAAGSASPDNSDRSGGDSSKTKPDESSAAGAVGFPGYQSIILWPISEKKAFILPPPPGIATSLDRIAKPLVIAFDGAYWYFQPPQKAPGPDAKIARGNPIAANVRSTNSFPLTMEAHQKLGTRVSLACCSAIQIEIESCDNLPGDMLLGVVLANSAATGRAFPSTRNLDLGLQPLIANRAAPVATGCTPTAQTLRFPVPHPSPMRKFDEIKVIFAPDPKRGDVGAKIAVKAFELIPR